MSRAAAGKAAEYVAISANYKPPRAHNAREEPWEINRARSRGPTKCGCNTAKYGPPGTEKAREELSQYKESSESPRCPPRQLQEIKTWKKTMSRAASLRTTLSLSPLHFLFSFRVLQGVGSQRQTQGEEGGSRELD
eukprot:10718779-Karenia_brevis.AAC.1